MGMDGVELLMAVEEHFGISIRDDEVAEIRTVGELVAIVDGRLKAAQTSVCSLLPAFLRLRTAARAVVNNNQLHIRPSMRLVDVLTSSQRRRLWTVIRDDLSLRASALRLPSWLRRLVATVILVVMPVGVVYLARIDPAFLVLAVLGWAFVSLSLVIGTARFASVPPNKLSTFGAIAISIAGTEVATKNLHLRTSEAVLDELRPIVARVLDIAPSKVVPAARFIEDLGMA